VIFPDGNAAWTQSTGVTFKAITLVALVLVSACSSSGSNASAGTGTGGIAGGTNGTGTGARLALNPKQMLQLDAGSLGAFGPIALAAAAGEGELFFSQANDAGSSYLLQHLSPAGAAVGTSFEIATGTPVGQPNVAVSSDGKEIACCWEDCTGQRPLVKPDVRIC
jgi:hypothetical protein